MKTTYNQAIVAYKALERTAHIMPPLGVARKLFDLRKAIQPHFEFYAEREQQIIEGAGGAVDMAGRVTFADGKAHLLYTNAMAELGRTEIEVNAEPVTMPDPGYTPQDLWELDGFVTVEGGE